MHVPCGLINAAIAISLQPSFVAGILIPNNATTRIIERDVVIIGGGASGSHAAVRLREDFGKSIVIVEKQDNLVCLQLLLFMLYMSVAC